MAAKVALQHSNKTQTARILELLKQHGSLTNYDLNGVCYRYGARLHELKREGHKIVTVHEKGSLRRYVYAGHEDDKS